MEPKVSSTVRPASNWLLPVKDISGQENECRPTQIADSEPRDTPAFPHQASLQVEARDARKPLTGRDIEFRTRSG
jgi:hypothetical protein